MRLARNEVSERVQRLRCGLCRLFKRRQQTTGAFGLASLSLNVLTQTRQLLGTHVAGRALEHMRGVAQRLGIPGMHCANNLGRAARQ